MADSEQRDLPGNCTDLCRDEAPEGSCTVQVKTEAGAAVDYKFESIGNKDLVGKGATENVLEPLNFHDDNDDRLVTKDECSCLPISCLLCDKIFEDTGVRKNDSLLQHLLLIHQLVIADVDAVAHFKRYIYHWKKQFEAKKITDICSVININTKTEGNFGIVFPYYNFDIISLFQHLFQHPNVGPKLQYYLLCDGLPEDKDIREKLQFEKLQRIVQCQQRERSDTHFSRRCLFCKKQFEGNRSFLFEHMVQDHGFTVGLPDNLVYVNELLDKMEEKLNNLQCLYCEKLFKDRTALVNHMRKKQHKKINPKNKEFDKYYIINYLEVGKTWYDILEEDDSELCKQSPDNDWEDWKEEALPHHCLFCENVSYSPQDLLKHMRMCHDFNLLRIKKSLALSFYEEVKIINYIRRQVYFTRCIYCTQKFDSRSSLLRHQTEQGHFQLPERRHWDQPQYFFPTFENDALLCGLPDDDEDFDEEENDDDLCCSNEQSEDKINSMHRHSELKDDNILGQNRRDDDEQEPSIPR